MFQRFRETSCDGAYTRLFLIFPLSLHMAVFQNKLIIIAAPSGAGKTSVTRHLLKALPNQLAFSISAATRLPRNNEKDKVDYYFITVEDFKNKIEQKEFVEWEMVYEGKYYGTLKSELQRIWQQYKAPLLDVDVQGGINIQQQFPNSSLSLNLPLLKNWKKGYGPGAPKHLNRCRHG